MTKEAMQKLIQKELSKKLGEDFKITIQEVLKTNVKLDGLTIWKKGDNISPTIYIEPYYEKLKSGIPSYLVINEILQTYFNARTTSGQFDTSSISTFQNVKDRLFVKLVNKHLNKEMIQNVPHILFLDDFAVAVHCSVEMEEETASFLVNNSHMKMWELDADTLVSLAIENTRKLLGIEVMNIVEVLKQMCPGLPDNEPIAMWIMTNKKKLAGAATVLFDDVLKSFAKEHGNFYVIFSSVDEVLLIPASDGIEGTKLTEMNQEVNEREVDAEDVLGTKAYYYCIDKGFIIP